MKVRFTTLRVNGPKVLKNIWTSKRERDVHTYIFTYRTFFTSLSPFTELDPSRYLWTCVLCVYMVYCTDVYTQWFYTILNLSVVPPRTGFILSDRLRIDNSSMWLDPPWNHYGSFRDYPVRARSLFTVLRLMYKEEVGRVTEFCRLGRRSEC